MLRLLPIEESKVRLIGKECGIRNAHCPILTRKSELVKRHTLIVTCNHSGFELVLTEEASWQRHGENYQSVLVDH